MTGVKVIRSRLRLFAFAISPLFISIAIPLPAADVSNPSTAGTRRGSSRHYCQKDPEGLGSPLEEH